jgi:hypothetical protein
MFAARAGVSIGSGILNGSGVLNGGGSYINPGTANFPPKTHPGDKGIYFYV